MLLRTLWLSLDSYMHGRMSDAPWDAKPVGIGDVMEGGTVNEVVESNIPQFAKGDIVVGRTGWQTHALSDGAGLQKVDPTEHLFRLRWASWVRSRRQWCSPQPILARMPRPAICTARSG